MQCIAPSGEAGLSHFYELHGCLGASHPEAPCIDSCIFAAGATGAIGATGLTGDTGAQGAPSTRQNKFQGTQCPKVYCSIHPECST